MSVDFRFRAASRPLARLMLVVTTLFASSLAGCRPAPISAPGAASAAGVAPPTSSPLELLERMAEAYRTAPAYGDAGVLIVQYVDQGERRTDELPFSVAFERPGKLRLAAFQALVASDGARLRAVVQDLPDQVLDRPAPPAITPAALDVDPTLQGVLAGRFGLKPFPLVMLTEPAALEQVRAGTEPPELLPSQALDGHDCHRVRLPIGPGRLILWIDARTSVVRRIDYPSGGVAPPGSFEVEEIRAEFRGAEFKAPPVEAFRLAAAPDARAVEQFVAGGPPVPPFRFLDRDGRPVTRESLLGRVAIFEFFTLAGEHCPRSLKQLDEIWRARRDDDRLRIYAVYVNESDKSNDELQAYLDTHGVSLPVLRDPENASQSAFAVTGVPAACVLGPDGVVRDASLGFDAERRARLDPLVDRLLAAHGSSAPAAVVELPPVKLAPASEPSHWVRTRLWRCDTVNRPGAVVAYSSPDEPRATAAVIEDFSGLALLADDGSVLRRGALNPGPDEPFVLLRSAVTGGRGPRFVVLAPRAAQARLVDDQLVEVARLPRETDHPGLLDAALADLDGDGASELLTTYWDVAGVRVLPADGSTKWRAKLENAWSVAVVPGAVAANDPAVWTASGDGRVASFTTAGAPLFDGRIDEFRLRIVRVMSGPDGPALAGIATVRPGSERLIGFSPEGQAHWDLPLAEGLYAPGSGEPLLGGQVLDAGPATWVVAGPDAVISLVTADGRLLDQFGVGAPIHGLAPATIDGRPALIITLPDAVEAWRFTAPGAP